MPSNTRTYKDLDLDFIAHPVTKDLSKKLDDDAIRRSVRNLLQTNAFDKKFHPEIGSNITSLLFEPINSITANLIKNAVTETIENYEPRVDIESITVSSDSDNNGFNVSLLVRIVNLREPINISIFLQRLR